MPKKLFISDERMLLLMAWAIDEGIANTETEYMEMISFPRTNISNVRKGLQSFTREHILNACTLTGASADYIFGFTNKIARKNGAKPIQLLKEAVMAIENHYGKSQKSNR